MSEPATPDIGTMQRGLADPWTDAFEIAPDDDDDLPRIARGLYAGEAGEITFITPGGTTLTMIFGEGEIKPVCARRVLSSGTDVTTIYGGV